MVILCSSNMIYSFIYWADYKKEAIFYEVAPVPPSFYGKKSGGKLC